jgi:hypothetical protein
MERRTVPGARTWMCRIKARRFGLVRVQCGREHHHSICSTTVAVGAAFI